MKEYTNFTKDEMAKLKSNPYTKTISAHTITHTREFNEDFIKEFFGEGKNAKDIFIEHGYDLEILKNVRIVNYPHRLRRSEKYKASIEEILNSKKQPRNMQPENNELLKNILENRDAILQLQETVDRLIEETYTKNKFTDNQL